MNGGGIVHAAVKTAIALSKPYVFFNLIKQLKEFFVKEQKREGI